MNDKFKDLRRYQGGTKIIGKMTEKQEEERQKIMEEEDEDRETCENCGWKEFMHDEEHYCKKFKAKTSLDKKSKGLVSANFPKPKGCSKGYLFFNGMNDIQSVCGIDGLCPECKAKNHSPCGVSGNTPGEMAVVLGSNPSEDTPSGKLETDASEPEGTPSVLYSSEGAFNLSEKIIKLTDGKEDNWISCILRDDVKEAIKKLKKLYKKGYAYDTKVIHKDIDKIFGKNLSGDL